MFSLLQAQGASVRLQAHEEKAFLSWMRETNNFFVGDEYQSRLGIWLTNKRYVQEFNKKGEFRVELNHLSHYTQAEYNALLGFRNIKVESIIKEFKPSNDVPDALDWRESGAVNEVKNQGQCGSCWAFSTIQSIEGVYAKNKGELYSLSEQNLVDCDKTCSGCNGGLMDNAFKYVIANQGGFFNLESDYPYTGKAGSCAFDASKGYAQIKADYQVAADEESLKTASATIGPIAIAIDASHISFQLYSKGIYNPLICSSKNLDHAVGLIGYGTDSGKDYWLVRNSWGASWGEKGYIRMIRNKKNKCGVATMAFYPELA
jgi:cathepsin L